MESFVLTIPEAIAVVGSVVTVVLGVFGYLLKTRNAPAKDRTTTTPTSYLETQVQGAHDRISEVKDRVTTAEGDIKLTVNKLEAIRQTLLDHQVHFNHSHDANDKDHEMFQKKMDKMMDILIKILTDDKL